MEEGQDSFLDVISNMVGILIILVMIAGVRASQSSPLSEMAVEEIKNEKTDEATLGEIEKLARDNAERQRQLQSQRTEMTHTEMTVAMIREKITAQNIEYGLLIDRLSSIKAAVEIHKEELDENERDRYQKQLQFSLIETECEQLEKQWERLQSSKPKATVIENKPTPLAREVDGREAHFRLKGGRVSFVPFDSLFEKMRLDVGARKNDYFKRSSVTNAVGPIDGYRLLYTLVTFDVMASGSYDGGGLGKRLELDYGEYQPVNEMIGEPVERAMQADGEMMRRLALYRPDLYTITFWVYPDSYEAYRQLRQRLYQRGYKVAGRPLATDQPIAVSPRGSKTNSQ